MHSKEKEQTKNDSDAHHNERRPLLIDSNFWETLKKRKSSIKDDMNEDDKRQTKYKTRKNVKIKYMQLSE